MLAFKSMLIEPAKKAGMAVPEVADVEAFDLDSDENRENFPHFTVFCLLQLGAPMPSWSSHWRNAEVIANMTVEQIRTFLYEDYINAGCEFGFPVP